MLAKIKLLVLGVREFYEHFDEHPLKRLRQFEYGLNKLLSFMGLAFLDKNWKYNVLTVIKLSLFVVFVFFWSYTVWVYHDRVELLEVLCSQGVFVPVKY